MKSCRIAFLFAAVFLLDGCSIFGSVDYNKIETFDVILKDINDEVITCHYQRGYNVKCDKEKKNETF